MAVKKGELRESPRSDINVTPLVDVCLVLLIIFLVVTPMLDRNADVSLPQTPKPGALGRDVERVTIAMKPDGTTWLGSRWLPPDDLRGRLVELRERAAGKELVLVADRKLSFGEVRSVLTVVRKAGYPGISLAAARRPED